MRSADQHRWHCRRCSSRADQQYKTWTLTFTQTLYLGPTLLDDPLGTPKFARTWEVSNIDDPDQYTALEA